MMAIIAEEVLRRAEKEAIDAVEVFVQRKTLKKIVILKKEIKQTIEQEQSGVGIRAIVKNKLSFVSSNSAERINEVVELAKQNARASNQVVDHSFVNKRFITPVEGIRDPRLIDLSLDAACGSIIEILASMEDKTSIRNLEGTVAFETEERLISNSEGLWKREVGTRMKVSLATTIDENGIPTTGTARLISRKIEEDWQALFNASLKNASALSSRRPLSIGRPRGIILAPSAVAKIIAYALLPSFFNSGGTVSLDTLRAYRFNKNLQLIDNPTYPGAQNTFGWDDEGYPSKPRIVVSGGKCRRLLGMNFACSGSSSQTSFPGNCYRVNFMNIDNRSYIYPPTISSSNFVVQVKKGSQKDVLSGLSSGIYIKDVAGAQDANFSTGDFVVTVTEGFEVKNGEIVNPIFPCYLSGNIYTILEDPMLLLGRELKEEAIPLTPFNIIVPDLLTTKITVSI
ncbi:hypothetical protein DRO91_04600 [Candidatus Heimdallarchaeota archaeon]|nr:MAG: hypothetical protein DRP02_09575 [Candidatus Gerdarchaeota archaeon]RLI72355.1 MAG: hypothetical protein DRO91_04600 [Candidatus Heimdallarchaeota archaeon]